MSAALDALAEAEPQLRAGSAIDMITRERRDWERRRPKALSARECLIAIEHEIYIVMDYATKMAAGDYRCTEDHERLLLAVSRISTIRGEALR